MQIAGKRMAKFRETNPTKMHRYVVRFKLRLWRPRLRRGLMQMRGGTHGYFQENFGVPDGEESAGLVGHI